MGQHSSAVNEECFECGSTQGPDREARWTCGDPDLVTWQDCPSCGESLCDSCAESGIHRCDYLDRA